MVSRPGVAVVIPASCGRASAIVPSSVMPVETDPADLVPVIGRVTAPALLDAGVHLAREHLIHHREVHHEMHRAAGGAFVTDEHDRASANQTSFGLLIASRSQILPAVTP